jgi:hypothetical protein
MLCVPAAVYVFYWGFHVDLPAPTTASQCVPSVWVTVPRRLLPSTAATFFGAPRGCARGCATAWRAFFAAFSQPLMAALTCLV